MARVSYSAMTLPTGVAVGLALDAAIGDPHRGHPVAAFGIAAAALERRMWRDDRLAGAAFTCVAVGVPLVAAGSALLWGRSFLPRVALTAGATWAVVGGTTLGREARGIGSALVAGDVEEARVRLPALVGRDPASLSPGEIARAVVESVAENTSDAVVAPLVWGALAGVPGMVAYRAINTLDAMVGYRSAEVRAVRLGRCASGRRGQLGAGTAQRLARRRALAATSGVASVRPLQYCAATAVRTRVPTPAGARLRSPARSG